MPFLPRSGSRSRFPAASVALPLLILSLAACQPTIELRGDLPDPDGLKQITPGQSSKADVTGLIGSPSSISTFDPNTWYYISRKVSRKSFLDPKVLNQKVYVVDFDNQGIVKDVQVHLDDIHNVAMNANSTPAPGRELTLLQQLIGNFGKFNSNTTPSDSGGAGGGKTGPS